MKARYKEIECKRVLEKSPKSQFKCQYRISPYIGCTSGCVYCPKGTGMGIAFGNIETPQVNIRINSPDILKNELRRSKKGLVCIGGYGPVEREYRLIRKLLAMLNGRGFPVHITTRSDVVLDDLDVLERFSDDNPCYVSVCLNSSDPTILEIFEPDTPSPGTRLEVLGKLSKAGMVTGLAIAPVLPFITDGERDLEVLIDAAVDKGARYIMFECLRMEDDVRRGFIGIIKRHFPDILVKYRRLYEFGSSPEYRYARQVRAVVVRHLTRYQLPDFVPCRSEERRIKQSSLEGF